MKHRIALAAFAAALAAAPAAQAATKVAETYTTVTRVNGSDPSDCNKLRVLKMGPSSAKNVVVLIPGYLGGSGDFRVIGRRLVPALKNKAQVWGIDRRSQCLEDVSGFSSSSMKDILGYYYFSETRNGKKFTPAAIGDPGVEAARNWGLKTTLEDVRAVVLAAKTGGRKVVLGGHSLGGSLTSEYATWDFNGTAGYKDLAGMVLVDGAARGTFGAQPDQTAINSQIAALSTGNPFSQILPGAPTYLTGVLPEMSAMYAIKEPKSNAALQGLLNAVGFGAFTREVVKETGKPTKGLLNNEGGLGYAFDRDTSPESFQLFHMNMGSLKPSTAVGGADGWQDGGITDLADVKQLFGVEPGNFVEWYFPKRLSIEVGAATNLSQNSVTDSLGLRPWHLADVNVPLYAFETGLTCSARPVIKPGDASTVAAMMTWIDANKSTECGVLTGARSLKNGSKITNATFVSDHNQEHLDPLVARAKDNKFQSTVTTFLKSTFGIK
jgi:pimeloyl-ACP methyl ester carboxylesterase